MAKEWMSWEKFNAVEKLTAQQCEDLPKDVKIIGTRWVRADKNSKPRLLAPLHVSKNTGKSKEQILREFPFEAKSRLVAQGHQEEGNELVGVPRPQLETGSADRELGFSEPNERLRSLQTGGGGGGGGGEGASRSRDSTTSWRIPKPRKRLLQLRTRIAQPVPCMLVYIATGGHSGSCEWPQNLANPSGCVWLGQASRSR